MKIFNVKIQGLTPLLHHRMREEELFGLLGVKTIKKKDKEELTPREIADGYAYKNDKGYYIPGEYILGALGHVAGDYKQKNSIRKSLKAVIKGIVRPMTDQINLKTKDGVVIKDFEVDIKKATNHQKGAVAVCRPRFDDWGAEFQLEINDELVSPETCLQILQDAGRRAGIGSFRVQRGGYFGQFEVTNWAKSKD